MGKRRKAKHFIEKCKFYAAAHLSAEGIAADYLPMRPAIRAFNQTIKPTAQRRILDDHLISDLRALYGSLCLALAVQPTGIRTFVPALFVVTLAACAGIRILCIHTKCRIKGAVRIFCPGRLSNILYSSGVRPVSVAVYIFLSGKNNRFFIQISLANRHTSAADQSAVSPDAVFIQHDKVIRLRSVFQNHSDRTIAFAFRLSVPGGHRFPGKSDPGVLYRILTADAEGPCLSICVRSFPNTVHRAEGIHIGDIVHAAATIGRKIRRRVAVRIGSVQCTGILLQPAAVYLAVCCKRQKLFLIPEKPFIWAV